MSFLNRVISTEALYKNQISGTLHFAAHRQINVRIHSDINQMLPKK